MPVGEFAYQGREGKDTCVHTECMAQVLMKEAQREDEHRTTRENNKKLRNRREYNGWRMDSVPSNARLAERMGCRPAPQGLCCLVLDEASKTVRVGATLEPSASVNLEYLLLALKVGVSVPYVGVLILRILLFRVSTSALCWGPYNKDPTI